jgi:hypothetical protein
MDWSVKYHPQRDQYWPAVEQVLASLPPPLFRQAVLLKDNLATFYTRSGRFQDMLSRPHDPPLLYWHFWLLDDLGVEERLDLDRELFLGMVFTFAGVYTQETILDEGSNFDTGYLLLGQTLHRQAEFHFHHLFPMTSSFWVYAQKYWAEYATAVLAPPPLKAAEALSLLPGRLAFTKLSAAAAAIGAGQEQLLPQLELLLDGLNFVLQLLREISTLRRDLARRIYSYPLLKTLEKAGLDPRQALSPEQILGALVLTGTMTHVREECLAQLTLCREIAAALSLPIFDAYTKTLEGLVDEILSLFSLKRRNSTGLTTPGVNAPKAIFAPSVETLPKVIQMAEGYLLSDLSFRESWEVQRRGVFGLSEMIGQAFPTGLIVELLCLNGHALAEPINTVFETLQQSGFRYYPHPHLPPDTDDLGLLLRLYPNSSQPALHREMLQAPLRWLQESLRQAGEIPVWLVTGATAPEPQPPVALWGHRCAAVEANLLLGLIAYDASGYREVIEQGVTSLSERWASRGLSATAHYVPLYSLWVTLELLAKLPAAHSERVGDSLEQLQQTILHLLEREIARPALSPQEAAFLILACLTRGNGLEDKFQALLRPAWPLRLYKSQRYDGSWAAETLYGTPTRGEFAAWYSSRTMTTAFGYHALKRYEATRQAS